MQMQQELRCLSGVEATSYILGQTFNMCHSITIKMSWLWTKQKINVAIHAVMLLALFTIYCTVGLQREATFIHLLHLSEVTQVASKRSNNITNKMTKNDLEKFNRLTLKALKYIVKCLHRKKMEYKKLKNLSHQEPSQIWHHVIFQLITIIFSFWPFIFYTLSMAGEYWGVRSKTAPRQCSSQLDRADDRDKSEKRPSPSFCRSPAHRTYIIISS